MPDLLASLPRSALATLMLLGCCSASARADDDSAAAAPAPEPVLEAAGPRWTVGGYGTLGVAHSSDHQADYRASVLTNADLGYTRDWSVRTDSLLALQVGVEIDRDWTAVVQLVSENGLAHGYRPQVEWAYISYRVSPELSLRLGRITLPMFLSGDYRKVGYALPWVRPPAELYGAVGISSSDGIDASYRWSLGGVRNVTQAFVGRSDLPIGGGETVRTRDIVGLSNTITAGALTVRASALTSSLTVGLTKPLFDAFRMFGTEGAQLADRYELSNKRANLGTLGASYDPGDWFLMGEASRMNAHSYMGDQVGAYVSAGYRFGDLTPYATYSASRSNTDSRVAGLTLDYLPPQLAAVGAQLNGGLNAALATIPRQRTIAAGLRWDWRAGSALKLQFERVKPTDGSNGTFVNVQPGVGKGRPVNVTSAVIDFVF